jgi:hypothetical protein
MKEQVYRSLSLPVDSALGADDRDVQASLTHPDAAEGAASLQERRPARFAPLGGAP